MRHFLIVWIIFLGLFGCNEKATNKILIPDGLEVIQPSKNSNELCLSCSKKLILYINMEKNSMYLFGMHPDFWSDLRDNYSTIGVICVISGQNPEKKRDREYVIQSLEKVNFPFQVLYDPENKFFELNDLKPGKNPKSSIQTFFTNEDVFFSSPEIGIPELYQVQLKEFLGE